MLQRLPRLHRAFAPVHCWWLMQPRATAAAGAAAAAAGAAAATATAVVALASQSGGGTAAGCAARVQCPEPLVGVWSQDMAACESMGPFLQGLGVPWFVWPIVDQLHTALHISAPAPGALQIVDQTLFGAAAAGIVPSHTYRNIAHACIRHSARATVQAMNRYQGRANHEQHVPSMGLLFSPSFRSTHKGLLAEKKKPEEKKYSLSMVQFWCQKPPR